jgi:hypothetical protein
MMGAGLGLTQHHKATSPHSTGRASFGKASSHAQISGMPCIRGRLIARQHHCQGQPGVRYPPTMIAVRRSSRFLRGVADHCAILLALRAFERRVQIRNPRSAQHRPRRCRKVPVEPGHARRFVHPGAYASRASSKCGRRSPRVCPRPAPVSIVLGGRSLFFLAASTFMG